LEKTNSVIYTTGELFLSEFIESIIDKKLKKFRDKYYNTDALLIDDIQSFQGKVETMYELNIIFDILHNKNIQMVFTSDELVAKFAGISDNLVSKFNEGLCINIPPLDFDKKCILIKNIVKTKGILIDGSDIEKLASTPIDDIRYIISNINSMKARNKLGR
jgi:chromosomal replication initiator protein